jgi:hypothetical protein
MQKETVGSPTGDTSVVYSRDALKRTTLISVTQDGTGYMRSFNYVPRGTEEAPEGTTNYIESITYFKVQNNYPFSPEKTEAVEYNNDGNIVKYGDIPTFTIVLAESLERTIKILTKPIHSSIM